MRFGFLPPEINSGLMYSGAGAAPLLAAASAWDGLAVELHAAAAGYGSVVDGLTAEGWMGPASASMAAAAAPYAAWMRTTATQAEQTAAQARAAVAAYETAFTATVPPPVIAANRTQLATLVATNVLGQNTPAIAATEAHYTEMWAQDVTAMHSYDAATKNMSALSPFTQPKQTTNPGGLVQQAGAAANAAAGSTASHLPSAAAATTTLPTLAEIAGGADNARTAVSWATFVPQNGSYIFSLANAMSGLARAFGAGGGAAAGAAAATNALGGAAPAAAGLGGLGVLTGAIGQSGTIGALSVPQAWAAASPVTGSVGGALGSAGLGAASSLGTPGSSGMMSGLPMLAHALRGADGHNGAMPRFDLRPSVIPRSPAAG